jgi:S-adenosylmethionine hydrolase
MTIGIAIIGIVAENFIVAPTNGTASSEKKRIPNDPIIEASRPLLNPKSRKATIHGTAMKSKAAIPQGSLTSGARTRKMESVPRIVDVASSRTEKIEDL